MRLPPRPKTIRFLLLLGASLVLCIGCRTNPVTGRKQLIIHSTEQELSLGEEYHPNLLYMYDGHYQDEQLVDYLEAIVRRIDGVSHRKEVQNQFTLLNTSIHNAFAIPGRVYATRGFVAELENEAQFAAVMAHEIAHVTSLHTARQMTTSMLTALGLGVAGQMAGNTSAAQGVLLAGQAGVTLLGLSYSREQERQADRVGTYYMAVAGWDPREAIGMQKLLHSLNERETTFVDKYLSTHPPAEDRIGEVRALIEEKNLIDGGYIQGDGIFEERWTEHLRELREVNKAYEPYDKGQEHLSEERYEKALAAAEQALSERQDQAPFHRLKGDALLGLDRIDEAEPMYRQALEVDNSYVPANLGLGRVALRQDRYEKAEKHFTITTREFPANLMGHYGLGVARFYLNKYSKAIAPLNQVTESARDEPEPHYYLAVCYQKTDRPRRALRHYRAALETGLDGERAADARRRSREIESQMDTDDR
ncbi:MAG: M48 family metalloprotease [Planctomycetota bacterium]